MPVTLIDREKGVHTFDDIHAAMYVVETMLKRHPRYKEDYTWTLKKKS